MQSPSLRKHIRLAFANPARRRGGDRRSWQHRPQVEHLEDRCVPAVITPTTDLSQIDTNAPGHHVEFRKGPFRFVQNTGDSLSAADVLFALPQTDARVIAAATDDGVATINYVDTGGGNLFGNPRDAGAATLTMTKTTGPAGGPTAAPSTPTPRTTSSP